MPRTLDTSVLADLRERVQRLKGRDVWVRRALPLDVPEIDGRPPGGGRPLGALHKIAGGGNGAVDGAAAAILTAWVAARTKGKILRCVTRQDLFAQTIPQAGLAPGRVIFVGACDEKTTLACFEHGLRHDGLGAIVAEFAKLSMTGSRRLPLAAEGSGTLALAVRRWRRQAEAADIGQPTASVTRWRISVLPSRQLPVPGVGRAFWLLELLRSPSEKSAGSALRCFLLPISLPTFADAAGYHCARRLMGEKKPSPILHRGPSGWALSHRFP